MVVNDKKIDYLVVDTTAFIENAALQNIANNVVTVQEVVNEITNKRQLRRLVVLPYDLVIKDVFPENVQTITEFSQKTGDYPSLSATDIKVMALTYQLEKAEVGTGHLRDAPSVKNTVNIVSKPQELSVDTSGFFMPTRKRITSRSRSETENSASASEQLALDVQSLNIKNDLDALSEHKEQENENVVNGERLLCPNNVKETSSECENDSKSLSDSKSNLDDKILPKATEMESCSENSEFDEDEDDDDDDDDDEGWITPSNVHEAKKQINSENLEERSVKVACITTDFAMQNVLKQMNLNVCALDGRIIKQLKTYILRCYACFKTTSIMTTKFCPKCGNATLKRVSVSVDSEGKQQVHINAKHPLTARGKKFSLPTVRGGKHSNNPILSVDQPMPHQRPTRLARTKNNPLDDDYIAGYSPFVARDVNSKSAQLGIRSGKEIKHWMRKNPNEARAKRK